MHRFTKSIHHLPRIKREYCSQCRERNVVSNERPGDLAIECKILEINTAVGTDLALDASDLAGGELGEARVVGVVHIVVDGVDLRSTSGTGKTYEMGNDSRLRQSRYPCLQGNRW